ncbi:hypothetical protein B0T18DRAFT_428697 [Schizothecium vesticola]|uniref:Uncharacterized protein n=1 Tax=Schizothecium vesticola TaxID=314040 RepID=A0AA40EUE0_9PEZI|nr:hypothetical protein B0T18DRAFT_428697 [Schizothecium vesticola]
MNFKAWMLIATECLVEMTSGLLAATAALAADPSGTRELSVEFQLRKDTAQSSITVWHKKRTELLGHSCSSKLTMFQDDHVTFEVDQNGRGNITIGSLSYIVHEDANSPEASFYVLWARGWITGGFAVELSVETGSTYNCEGKEGEKTAYTVRNADYNRCTGISDRGGPYVMWSPNSNDRGSEFYCVHGAQYCRNKGDRWLDTNGRAGGLS